MTMSVTMNAIPVLCDDSGVLDRIVSVTSRCGFEAEVVEDTMQAVSSIDGAACSLIAYFARIEPLHLRFVRKLHERRPHVGIIVVGGEDTAAAAVDVMRAGADYYVATSGLEDRLFDALEALMEAAATRQTALDASEEASSPPDAWAGPFGDLRDTLRGLMSLSRTAMSAMEHGPRITIRTASSAGPRLFEAGMTMRDLERRAIEEALRRCDNNRTRAADLLQISIRTLHRKIREYGLP